MMNAPRYIYIINNQEFAAMICAYIDQGRNLDNLQIGLTLSEKHQILHCYEDAEFDTEIRYVVQSHGNETLRSWATQTIMDMSGLMYPVQQEYQITNDLSNL